MHFLCTHRYVCVHIILSMIAHDVLKLFKVENYCNYYKFEYLVSTVGET